MTTSPVIIVGAGPGLGLAVARAFALQGHPVALLARRAEALSGYVEDLRGTGVAVRSYAADAADPSSLRAGIHAAISDLGAPEALVYNAAVLRADSPTDGDDSGWVTALAVDVLGAKIAAETVLPELVDGRGSLLFTGGGFALYPDPQFASVSVGKAALRAYATALHAEQQDRGVHATSVTIAGSIGGGQERFAPEALAARYVELHRQPRAEWAPELVID